MQIIAMASVIRRFLGRSLRDVTTVTPEDLRAQETFPRLVPDPLEVPKPELATAQVICIASGKGGTGKSVVSTNLAVAIAREGLRVLLFDADLGLANAHLLMGVTPTHDISSVLAGERMLADTVVECPEGVRLIAGGSGFSELAELKDWQLRNLASQLKALEAETDLVIVDLAAGISPQVMRFLNSAHDAILVTTPDVTALLDVYATIKSMAKARGELTVKLIVNRAKNEAEAIEAYEKIRAVTARHLTGVTVSLFEWIPHNWYIQNSVNMRQPVVTLHPKSFVTRSFQSMAGRIKAEHGKWKLAAVAAAESQAASAPESFSAILERTVYA
ncbi:MAG: MinD/ParA family protein [bacterium]